MIIGFSLILIGVFRFTGPSPRAKTLKVCVWIKVMTQNGSEDGCEEMDSPRTSGVEGKRLSQSARRKDSKLDDGLLSEPTGGSIEIVAS